jgi:hypothetical protein
VPLREGKGPTTNSYSLFHCNGGNVPDIEGAETCENHWNEDEIGQSEDSMNRMYRISFRCLRLALPACAPV